MTRTRRALAAGIVLAAAASLAGCATTVSLEPAVDANDPACADVSVRLPGELAGQSRRWTDAQATGAWGEPSSILLTCGLDPVGPTALPCESTGAVDWIIDDSEAPNYRFTSFGRTPAVEVFIDYDVVSGRDVLDALDTAVSMLPTTGSVCTERPAS